MSRQNVNHEDAELVLQLEIIVFVIQIVVVLTHFGVRCLAPKPEESIDGDLALLEPEMDVPSLISTDGRFEQCKSTLLGPLGPEHEDQIIEVIAVE